MMGPPQQLQPRLATAPVRARVAEALIHLSSNKGGNGQLLRISRRDLAAYIGTARENLNRVISDFRADRLIRTDGDQIFLLDLIRLNSIRNMQETQRKSRREPAF